MNFLKTFLITLIVYLGLNTVFVLISMFTVPGYPMSDALYVTAAVFAPIINYPGQAWIDLGIVNLVNTTELTILSDTLLFLSVIIPPVVATILAARIGENVNTGFGAWFTTALVSCGIFVFLIGIGQLSSPYLYLQWLNYTLLYGNLGAVFAVLLAGLINGLFYGGIALLLSKKWL
jgi:hypothetical protein